MFLPVLISSVFHVLPTLHVISEPAVSVRGWKPLTAWNLLGGAGSRIIRLLDAAHATLGQEAAEMGAGWRASIRTVTATWT